MLHLLAPAKLNLYLRIIGKRPDGYHEIETVFERIDLTDELTFEPAPALSLTCTAPSLSCDNDNLVMKAARLLQQESRAATGAKIHLVKRIPIAAGLGGGSSDAATTLVGLNALWKLGLSRQRLKELGAQLGSDVPFFLEPEAVAIGRGRGEQCEPIPDVPTLWHVLVCPDAQLSTREVYQGIEGFNLTASRPSITMIAHALRNGSALAGLAEGLWNDLEPEAIRRCPIIALIQSHLRTLGCLAARISGSGPSVFGLCRDAAHAHDLAAAMRGGGQASWRVMVVQTDGDRRTQRVPEAYEATRSKEDRPGVGKTGDVGEEGTGA